MMENKKFFSEALVAGSGANYLLMTGSPQDQRGFKLIDISQYRMVDISMGGMFCLAINTENRLVAWGIFNTQTIKVPRTILTTRHITKVHCGWDHALILDSDSLLLGIGRNKEKQLSPSEQIYYQTPIQIQKGEGFEVRLIHCGFRQSYISNGIQIFGRGDNKNMQLGNVGGKQGWVEVGVVEEGVKKIQSGKKFMVALSNTNRLYGCGSNQYNVFNQNSQSIPTFQLLDQDIDDVSTGWSHLILYKNNSLQSHGRNNFGQLGREQLLNNPLISIPDRSQQHPISNLTSGTQFSFLTTNAKVYGWGWNQHFNISSTPQQTIPLPLQIQTDFVPSKIITYSASTLLLK